MVHEHLHFSVTQDGDHRDLHSFPTRRSSDLNPMVDGWMGDDWFHNGAFRQQNMAYIYDQEATRKSDVKWWTGHLDDYDVLDRKSTRLNSSHRCSSYAVSCLQKIKHQRSPVGH